VWCEEDSHIWEKTAGWPHHLLHISLQRALGIEMQPPRRPGPRGRRGAEAEPLRTAGPGTCQAATPKTKATRKVK